MRADLFSGVYCWISLLHLAASWCLEMPFLFYYTPYSASFVVDNMETVGSSVVRVLVPKPLFYTLFAILELAWRTGREENCFRSYFSLRIGNIPRAPLLSFSLCVIAILSFCFHGFDERISAGCARHDQPFPRLLSCRATVLLLNVSLSVRCLHSPCFHVPRPLMEYARGSLPSRVRTCALTFFICLSFS